MSEKEPDALRLADELLEQHQDDFYLVCDEAAIELRCLHAENSSRLAECDRLKALNAELAAELQNIANANPKNWDAPLNDTASFQAWAQSRARAALEKQKGETQ